jgi:hypothetical protein
MGEKMTTNQTSKTCNNCGGDCGGENSWDISEINVCQMCWENLSVTKKDRSSLCTACDSDNEGADLWDISDREKLCQMCWEQQCSDSYWDFFGRANDVVVAIEEIE